MLARRKHPGGSNKLDDLCTRYNIDNSRRTKHGALLDAELLAEVYIDLIGARQSQAQSGRKRRDSHGQQRDRPMRRAGSVRCRLRRVSPKHDAAHAAFVATLGGTPVWNEFSMETRAEQNTLSAGLM